MNRSSKPLIAWIVIQLAVLGVGALRVPLAARAGAAPQHFAFAECLVVQFAVSTMMLPALGGPYVGLAFAVAAMPVVQLAGLLTATPLGQECMAQAALLGWIVGLGCWSVGLKSTRSRGIAGAVLMNLLIGVPIASFLINEFTDADKNQLSIFLMGWNPLVAVLNNPQITASGCAATLLWPLTLLVGGIFLLIARRGRESGDNLST